VADDPQVVPAFTAPEQQSPEVPPSLADSASAQYFAGLKIPRIPVSKYWVQKPTAVQWAALSLFDVRELLFGGQVGGGKSSFMLMAASQFVDNPNWHALLFRRTFADLNLPGALLDRAREWWAGMPGVTYNAQDYRFTFPSGATITFGYLQGPTDHLRYQGSELTFIGYDEAQQLRPDQMTFMFSRLRTTADLPLQVRYTGNPGGIANDWLKYRFVDSRPTMQRMFVRAELDPDLVGEGYEQTLAEMDPVSRAQALGDWEAGGSGGFFELDDLDIVDNWIQRGARLVRFWDMASTRPTPASKRPDYTAGVLLAHRNGLTWVVDVQRFQENPPKVEALIKQQAAIDGSGVAIRMEQEPGSAGKTVISHYSRNVLPGYDFRGIPSSGAKQERARPVSAAIANGNVSLVRGQWNHAFMNELRAFPTGPNDDQVDGLSGAFNALTRPKKKFRSFT